MRAHTQNAHTLTGTCRAGPGKEGDEHLQLLASQLMGGEFGAPLLPVRTEVEGGEGEEEGRTALLPALLLPGPLLWAWLADPAVKFRV